MRQKTYCRCNRVTSPTRTRTFPRWNATTDIVRVSRSSRVCVRLSTGTSIITARTPLRDPPHFGYRAGYVGLPVAVAGAQQRVVGFDIDATRVAELRVGEDRTHEVESAKLAAADISFTSDPADLQHADFHIVAVPTPIDALKQPDLAPLLSASRTVGAQLKRGDIVVFESTVFPGATEEQCVPVLERESGLRAGQDFSYGYSPERINPGDKEHRFENILKVVSGSDSGNAGGSGRRLRLGCNRRRLSRAIGESC